MYNTIPVLVRGIEVLQALGTLIPPYGTAQIQASPTVDEHDKPNFAIYEKKLLNAYRTVQLAPHEIPRIRYLDYIQAVKIRGVNIGPSRQGYPGFFQTHQNLIPPRTLGSKKDPHGQELPWELE